VNIVLCPGCDQVRKQSKHEERERRLFQETSKLIVCANRKPVHLGRSKDGGGWNFDEVSQQHSDGTLPFNHRRRKATTAPAPASRA
jgi:hypothetical protein